MFAELGLAVHQFNLLAQEKISCKKARRELSVLLLLRTRSHGEKPGAARRGCRTFLLQVRVSCQKAGLAFFHLMIDDLGVFIIYGNTHAVKAAVDEN